MLRPPKTNDPALNRFLEEVANTIQDRVRPEEGWTLSDFASSVSEVISDKRDLIDIVTKYDNIEVLSEEMEAEIALLKNEIQDSMDLLSSVNSKSAEFAEVMEWWDQNYKVIFDAQAAMEIFGEISAALEGHQDILDQIAAATHVAEEVVAEVKAAEASAKAAEEAAKTSEINATDAAARAEVSETAVGEAREYVSGVHESWLPGGENRVALERIGSAAADHATNARDDRDAAAASATTAAADADRAESAAAGVDRVVADAAGVLAGEIADDLSAAQDARTDAESARDQAVGAASTASTKAGEAAASATLADGRATDAEGAVASIAAHATAAEGAATRAAASESNAAGSATAAQGHADRAATEAGAAAQIAAQEKIAQLVGDAPEQLDTIYELADAFADRGDAIAAIQDALANRVMGNHSSVISSTIPGAGTPTNQVTFVVEGT